MFGVCRTSKLHNLFSPELGLLNKGQVFLFCKGFFMKIDDQSNQKWWQFGHVWLVIALPAIVIVASFITLYLAMSRPNEIIDETYQSPSRQSDLSIEARRKESAMAPAMLGRNHAQTGIVPPSK